MLKPSKLGFNLNKLYNYIDQDKNFRIFMLKIAVEILIPMRVYIFGLNNET